MSDTLASRMSALPMDTIHFGARTLKRVMFIRSNILIQT